MNSSLATSTVRRPDLTPAAAPNSQPEAATQKRGTPAPMPGIFCIPEIALDVMQLLSPREWVLPVCKAWRSLGRDAHAGWVQEIRALGGWDVPTSLSWNKVSWPRQYAAQRGMTNPLLPAPKGDAAAVPAMLDTFRAFESEEWLAAARQLPTTLPELAITNSLPALAFQQLLQPLPHLRHICVHTAHHAFTQTHADSLRSLAHLESFECRWGQMSIDGEPAAALAGAVPKLRRLRLGHLTQQGLTNLCDLTMLVSLDIWYPLHKPLPARMQALENLRSLRLRVYSKLHTDQCRPETFQEIASWLPNLEVVNVATQCIGDAALLAPLGTLAHRRRLYLHDVGISRVPESACETLDALDVSGNAAFVLPVGKPLTALQDLNLSGTGLQNIPDVLYDYSALRKLNLSGNNLRDLPPELTRLTQLTHLDVRGNPLAPPQSRSQAQPFWALPQLPKLRCLALPEVDLSTLVPLASSYPLLTHLLLDSAPRGQAKHLPRVLERLTRLKRVYARRFTSDLYGDLLDYFNPRDTAPAPRVLPAELFWHAWFADSPQDWVHTDHAT